MPHATSPDPSLPVIVSREQALAAGLSRDQIRQRVRAGRWTTLASGIYRTGEFPDEPARQHVDRAIAASWRNANTVIGFESAALVHGLPLLRRIPSSVSLCVPPTRWTGTRNGIRFRGVDLDPGHVDTHATDALAGFVPRVTTPARTWIDIARTGRLASGLVTGDAVLRHGLASPSQLRAACMAIHSRRGMRQAWLALEHLSPLRESPLESISWAYLVRHGLPLPAMQVEIALDGDIARVDVLWRAEFVIGEIDGRMKYQTTEDLYREKRREDALRARGFRVIRWGAADLRGPGLAVRIRAALRASLAA